MKINTRRQAVNALTRLAEIEIEQRAISEKQKEELAPHAAKYEKATKPIYEKYAALVKPFSDEFAETGKALSDFLLNEKKDDGSYKLPELSAAFETLRATALVAIRPVRDIDPQKWFDTIKDRSLKFWQTIKVGVQAADEAFGKVEVDQIADIKTTASVSFKFEAAEE